MQHQNHQFEELIKKACSVLGSPYLTIREEYVSFPLCLMEYIDNGIHRSVIEITLKDYQVQFSCEFNLDNYCNDLHLSFDRTEDENLFIEYLKENATYDFKKSHWTINDCLLSVKSIIGTTFIFQK